MPDSTGPQPGHPGSGGATTDVTAGAGAAGSRPPTEGAAAASNPGVAPTPPPPAWAATLSGLVIDTVDSVKTKATVKAVTALRLVVYGVVVLAAVVTALLLLLVGVVRIWDVYVPLAPVGRRVWLGYVVLGGVFFAVGTWLLAGSQRRK